MNLLFLFFVVGSPLFVRGYSFENGILKCPTETVGNSFTKDSISFTKVNYSTLISYRDNNEFEKFTTSCTTCVTNMNRMFYNSSNFNYDISTWDTSSVLDMSYMFAYSSSFNSDISKWDTSRVEDMNNMFDNAVSFNSSISNLTTSSVKSMVSMFSMTDASLNQDISKWDT